MVDDGRLGHGDTGWKYVPKITQALQGQMVVQVTCGSYHTAAVTEEGTLYTWGGGMVGVVVAAAAVLADERDCRGRDC